jgi:hypothetical protein
MVPREFDRYNMRLVRFRDSKMNILSKKFPAVALLLWGLVITAPVGASEYEISYSGTMDANSINPPLASSFYGGEPFSGSIFFDSSAATTSSSNGWTYTAGEQMMLSVGPINAVTSPFTISRAVDLSPSEENYYYFDGAGANGALSASGYTLTRDVVLYQVPYASNPSLYMSLITTQAQINAGFPEWTLYMQFNN